MHFSLHLGQNSLIKALLSANKYLIVRALCPSRVQNLSKTSLCHCSHEGTHLTSCDQIDPGSRFALCTGKGHQIPGWGLAPDLTWLAHTKYVAFYTFCFLKFSQKCTVRDAWTSRSPLWPPRGVGSDPSQPTQRCSHVGTPDPCQFQPHSPVGADPYS